LDAVRISQVTTSQVEFKIEVNTDIPTAFEQNHVVRFAWFLDTDRNGMTSVWPAGFVGDSIGPEGAMTISHEEEWVGSIFASGVRKDLPRSSFTVSANSIIVTVSLAQLGNLISFDWISSAWEYWVDSNGIPRKDKPWYLDTAPSSGYETFFVLTSTQTQDAGTPPNGVNPMLIVVSVLITLAGGIVVNYLGHAYIGPWVARHRKKDTTPSIPNGTG
jgi:hypothetical protein